MALRFGGSNKIDQKYPIQMVPLLMREEGNEDYEPKVVSLGPYHHGKEKLKFVEDFKPTALEMFIRNSSKGYDDLFYKVLPNIGYAKSCYLQEYTCIYTNEEFARMMILDACVILNNIGISSDKEESVKQDDTIKHLGTPVYTSIRRDMYLLENQVPFRILEILVHSRYETPRHEFIKDIETFSFRMFFHDKEGKIELLEANHNTNDKQDLHLVEILQRVIVRGHDSESKSSNDHGCYNINDLVLCLDNSGCSGNKDDGIEKRGLYVFRSVTDLKSKGIESSASGIQSLKGVRFSPTELCRSAELKLPLLHVDMYTKVFFKNLIAYEFSPYAFINDKFVTAYVSFMKLLVVSKKDVKELRENKIIINSLGSDKEVVKLFHTVNTYEAEDKSSFWQVKRDIEEHYHSKAKTWMAELDTMYFSNPWSIIALVGTIFLLSLDIVQTYYSVYHN